MKQLIYITIAAITLLTSACNKFDELNDRLNEHEDRIAALEEQCRKLNSNIDALQKIMDALQENDYVTKVTVIEDNGVEVGYRLSFAKSGDATVYNNITDGAVSQFSVSEGYWYASFDEGVTDKHPMLNAKIAQLYGIFQSKRVTGI